MSDILTEKEIDELATALVLKSSEDGMPVPQEVQIEQHFQGALEYIRSNPKFLSMSVEEVFKWFYMLGVNTDCVKEIELQDVADFIEQADFMRLMEDAVKNPENVPKSMIVDVNDKENKIVLTADCCGYDCACSPQREDHCMSEDPQKCVFTVTMKHFNEMIGADK